MQYERILRAAQEDAATHSEAVILSSGLGVCKICEAFLRSYTIVRRAVGVVYVPGRSLFLLPLFRYLAATKRGHVYTTMPKTRVPPGADVFLFSALALVSDVVRGVLDLAYFDGFIVLAAGRAVQLFKVLAPALRRTGCWVKVVSDQPLEFASVVDLFTIQPQLDDVAAHHITALRVVHRAMPFVAQDLSPGQQLAAKDGNAKRSLFLDDVVHVDVGSYHSVHAHVWGEIRRWALVLSKQQPRYEAIAKLPQVQLIRHADLLFADAYIKLALEFLYHAEVVAPKKLGSLLQCYRAFLDRYEHPLMRPLDVRDYYAALERLCDNYKSSPLISAVKQAISTAQDNLLTELNMLSCTACSPPATPTRILVLLGTSLCANELADVLLSNTDIEIVDSKGELLSEDSSSIQEPALHRAMPFKKLKKPLREVLYNQDEHEDDMSNINMSSLSAAYREAHYMLASSAKHLGQHADELCLPHLPVNERVMEALTKVSYEHVPCHAQVVIIPTVGNSLLDLRRVRECPLYEKIEQLGLHTIVSIVCCGPSTQAVRALERIDAEYRQGSTERLSRITLTIVEGGPYSIVTGYPRLVNNVESEVMKVLHTASMHTAIVTYYDQTAEVDFGTLGRSQEITPAEAPQHMLYIDNRELKSTVPAELFVLSKGLKLMVRQLILGDYILSARTVIERKGEDDLIASIMSHRLLDQLERLDARFPHTIIICAIPAGRPHKFTITDLQLAKNTSTRSQPLSCVSRMLGALRLFPSAQLLWAPDISFSALVLKLKVMCIQKGDPELPPAEAEGMVSKTHNLMTKRALREIPHISEVDYKKLTQQYSCVYDLLKEPEDVLAQKTNQYVQHQVNAIAKEPLANVIKLLAD